MGKGHKGQSPRIWIENCHETRIGMWAQTSNLRIGVETSKPRKELGPNVKV